MGLRAAETEEKYAITWTSKKEQIFEMPTSGSAIMQKGENLLYLAKKEQCLALGTQLRTSFKVNDYKIYRIFPKRLNAGRLGVGNVMHSIGKNAQPVNVKFTGK